jgi:hypothetical protein
MQDTREHISYFREEARWEVRYVICKTDGQLTDFRFCAVYVCPTTGGLKKTVSIASFGDGANTMSLTHTRLGHYGSALVASIGSGVKLVSTYGGAGQLVGNAILSSANGLVTFTNLGIDIMGSYTLVFAPVSLSETFPTSRELRTVAARATVTVVADTDVAGLKFLDPATAGQVPRVQVVDAGRNDAAKAGVAVKGVRFNPAAPTTQDIAGAKLPAVGARRMTQFSIPGEGRFVAIANLYDNVQFGLDSAVYKWGGDTELYSLHQLIPTKGAYSFTFVKLPTTTGFDYFLTVANHFSEAEKYAVTSTIYQWNSTSKLFAETQSIQTYGATHLEHFSVSSNYFLAAANYFDGTYHSVPSTVHQWSYVNSTWRLATTPLQELETVGAHHAAYFGYEGESYLVVAQQWDEKGMTYGTKSAVFKWDASKFKFVSLTTLSTQAALHIEPFTIDGEVFLAVANSLTVATGAAQVNSPIYRLVCDNGKETFSVVQQVSAKGATRWKYFVRGGLHYLAVSHWVPSVSASNKILVYEWNKVSGAFEEKLNVATPGAFDVEVIRDPAGYYLLQSLPGEPQGKTFKIAASGALANEIAQTDAAGLATFITQIEVGKVVDFFSVGLEDTYSGPYEAAQP